MKYAIRSQSFLVCSEGMHTRRLLCCRYEPGDQVFLCYGAHSNLDLLGERLDSQPTVNSLGAVYLQCPLLVSPRKISQPLYGRDRDLMSADCHAHLVYPHVRYKMGLLQSVD